MHISIYLPFVIKKKSPVIDSFKLIYRILNQNKMPLKDVKLGENVKIPYDNLVNLYGCEIGPNCFIGPFVEIQKENGSFITREVEVGISDGINVEILKGVKEGDKIKVWNSIEDEDEDEVRRRQDENYRELED